MPGEMFINVKPKRPVSLGEFAGMVYRDLNVSAFSERESSNYIDEHYFTADSLGAKVCVSLADDDRFSDYQFWITLSTAKTWVNDGSFIEPLADLIARFLTMKGYEVARDPSGGRIGGAKLIYSRGAATTYGPGQVEVREVPQGN
jgi:hypothetical protein